MTGDGTMRRIGRGTLGAVIVALMIVAGAVARPERASAHPLGNFTVNQYTRIEADGSGLHLIYVLDLAEIPAFQVFQTVDANSDGVADDGERAAYLATFLPEILAAQHLTLDGRDLGLRAESTVLTFPEGQAGLKLMRLRAVLLPAGPVTIAGGSRRVAFRNDYAAERIGWREILVTHGAGVAVSGADVPAADASDELRSYPADLLKSPLDQRALSFGVALAPEAAAAGFDRFTSSEAATPGTAVRPGGGATGARFAALVNGPDLTRTGIVLSLLAAMVWGAMHALSPGHGKTVVGAYLVGSRGTPRHAVFLGLTVTITHTAGVLALGAVTLFLSQYILPETLFPWLSVASGALVIAMGLWTFQMRLRGHAGVGHRHHGEHTHDHPHLHEEGDGEGAHSHGGHTHSHQPPGQITWRALLALGISGGMIPCPSALLVLLGSIALGRVGFGLALVVAFSLGLAFTLTGLGLVFLFAGRVFERRISDSPRARFVMRYAPALGSLALTFAGVLIILRAIGQTGLR